jgi:hypothetical protein
MILSLEIPNGETCQSGLTEAERIARVKQFAKPAKRILPKDIYRERSFLLFSHTLK